ncbi:MAG TPA: ATP-binding protein [Oligoflexus sp.]|uniref:sensor histidine kinase n=1 Tax=Oligoflexus sp. TaxID=1971216 RepID=UPI002D23CAAD|nr:ATP-binding protein [Oligoflexus sp.]HYX36019.1 ATP-binding protein [Oligoflexus sp.]
MMRSKFFWKNFLSYCLIIGFTTFVVSYLLVLKTESFIEENAIEGLQEKLVLFESYFADGTTWREPETIKLLVNMAQETKTRLTVLNEDGDIQLESEIAQVRINENHRNRPEVKEAARNEVGTAKRYSDSTAAQTLYTAKKVQTPHGTLFIRLGVPIRNLEARVADILSAIAIGASMGMVLSLLIALIIVRRITDPVSEMTKVAGAISLGNYAARIRRLPNNELGTLGEAINRLAAAVQANISRREKMEKIRREFSSNISHELKTPLTSIKGYVDTLLEGALDDKANNMRFLRIINNNADRMISLVSDLLSLATIEANEGAVELDSVDWRPIVQEAINRQQIKLNSKEISLETVIDDGAPIVKGSRKAMSHILENLLQNAIHYTPAKGHVQIHLRREKGLISLAVKDNGIGIAKRDQPRIFERFYRVDTARSRNEGGTGLGLAIVKHLVIQIQGTISVESDIGQGSTFTVHLPEV